MVSCSAKTYSYRLNGYSESTATTERTLSLFENYASLAETVVTTTRQSEAYSTKVTTSSESRYAMGDLGKIRYCKTVSTASSGKQTTNYTHSLYEKKTSLSPTVISGFTTSYTSYESVMGTDKEGKLYSLYYAQSTSRTSAYDKQGASVSALSKTYTQYLIDLNTIEQPRYNSVSTASYTESNVDSDGVLSDTFRITSKNSSESTFNYGTLEKKEAERTALINEYPAVSVSSYNVLYAYNNYYRDYLTLTKEEGGYYSTQNYNPQSFSFFYSASVSRIDKQNEKIESENVEQSLMNLQQGIVKDLSSETSRGTVSENAISFSEQVRATIHFVTATTAPYLTISSIEIL
ncbi:MAG: hypothetical protein SPL80_01550 [Bacilli bacterium]|nr:hypothetical protein [Bacilli bacterium]